MYEMRSKGARFLLGETIKSVEVATPTTDVAATVLTRD